MHLQFPQLSGLGANPAAPQNILVRVAHHPAGRSGLFEQPGQLPDAVVEVLLTHDPRDVAVLHGRRVSPPMQRRIEEHPDPAVRDAYPAFVRQMVDRRVTMNIEAIEYAYRRSRTELLDDPDPKVRAAVAEAWHDRPAAAARRMLADPEPIVRKAATRYPIPDDLVAAGLADPATRSNVAGHAVLTADQVLRLVGEDECESLCYNPHLDEESIRILADVDHPAIRYAVALSRYADEATRDRLFAQLAGGMNAADEDTMIALTWGFPAPLWLLDEPLEVRLSYVDSPYAEFRCVVAGCSDLPDDVWARLDNDPDTGVRRAAARRPTTPADVLERLLREHGDVSWELPMLVDHPNLPRERVRTFADEADPQVRLLALHDPMLPTPTLAGMAGDPRVRSGVAGHPNLDEALFEQLLSDPEPAVVHAAAANPALPRHRMERLLADQRL